MLCIGNWRTIADILVAAKAGGGGTGVFEWQSCLRLYVGKVSRAKDVKCYGAVCDVKMEYAYKYVGDDFTPLVYTSAAHSVQLALISAQHMGYGGMISGPTSSGKTNVIRCTAQALGLPCVVIQVCTGCVSQIVVW